MRISMIYYYLILMGSKLSDSSLFSQFLYLIRDAGKTLCFCRSNNRSNESIFGCNGDSNISCLELANKGSLPRGVDLWDITKRKGCSLDDKVVHRQFIFSIGLCVQDFAQLDNLIGCDLRSEVVVWDGRLGLCETVGNDATNVGERKVLIRCCGWSSRSWYSDWFS